MDALWPRAITSVLAFKGLHRDFCSYSVHGQSLFASSLLWLLFTTFICALWTSPMPTWMGRWAKLMDLAIVEIDFMEWCPKGFQNLSINVSSPLNACGTKPGKALQHMSPEIEISNCRHNVQILWNPEFRHPLTLWGNFTYHWQSTFEILSTNQGNMHLA